MQLLLSLLTVGFFAFCLGPCNHGALSQGLVGALENLVLEREITLRQILAKEENINKAVEDENPTDEEEEKEITNFEDFENDDDDSEEDTINLSGLKAPTIESITHLHKKHGEILVPCFGMWWPVGGTSGGGGAVYYDYGVEYYDEDEGRKRKRSRKRKKAAKKRKRKKA